MHEYRLVVALTLCRLPCRYKYRLVVDESVALGVLGATGRGAAQAAGLSTKDVDIVAASLSASLCPPPCPAIKLCHRLMPASGRHSLSDCRYCFSIALARVGANRIGSHLEAHYHFGVCVAVHAPPRHELFAWQTVHAAPGIQLSACRLAICRVS
jgi:hypothetical protein